jgi:hypothetical protein
VGSNEKALTVAAFDRSVSLAKKLNLKEGQPIRVVNPPAGLRLDLPSDAKAEAVLVFVKDSKELAKAAPAFEAARQDRIAWIAYPKGGQLGTDLNRDRLWKAVAQRDPKIQPVRNISIDEVWSVLRFRPAKA